MGQAPEETASNEDQGAVATGWESLTADQALEELDGSGRILETAGEPGFLTDDDERAFAAAVDRDPETYETRMEFEPGEWMTSAPHPAVTAALLRAAKDLDLEYLGPSEDPEGREVVGFAFEGHDGWFRQELYLSPETGGLYAYRSIALRPLEDSTAQPPFVAGEAVYLENGLVTELPPRPEGVEDARQGDPSPVGSPTG